MDLPYWVEIYPYGPTPTESLVWGWQHFREYVMHTRRFTFLIPGDTDEQSESLFLAAASIGARRPGGRLSPRSVNTIVAEIGRIHDAETTDRGRHLGTLRPHDLRHTFGYLLSEASGHNRAELERRLGHANDRYLRLYTNSPDDIAASYVEDL